MATTNKNARSQLATVRVLPNVMQGMESAKLDGESNAGFIITTMRGEIARRQTEGSGKNPPMSSLDALAKAEQIDIKATEKIGQPVTVACEELQRCKAKGHK